MPTPPPTSAATLRLGHSPDPDDAFMWYPLADFVGPDGKTHTPRIDTRGHRFTHVLEDIESLNERAAGDDPDQRLEITALSIHQYPYIADRYVLTTCGASMGDGYGPMLVAPNPLNLRDLLTRPPSSPATSSATSPAPADPSHRGPRIAIPGERTTAFLALQLMLRELEGVQPGSDRALDYVVVRFDQIIPRVAAGEFDAGLIIHEGQLTYADQGLHCIVDLGRWWTDTRGLPLPLGGNAIRRDLVYAPAPTPPGDPVSTTPGRPAEAGPAPRASDAPGRQITDVLHDSIRYALDHRREAVAFALGYARDMGEHLADRFVGMYVNDWTLDYGERGRLAVRRLIHEGIDAGLVPPLAPGIDIDFVAPNMRS